MYQIILYSTRNLIIKFLFAQWQPQSHCTSRTIAGKLLTGYRCVGINNTRPISSKIVWVIICRLIFGLHKVHLTLKSALADISAATNTRKQSTVTFEVATQSTLLYSTNRRQGKCVLRVRVACACCICV